MADRLILDRVQPDGFSIPEAPGLKDVLDELIRDNARSRTAYVERRILEGENEIRLPYIDERDGREIVYTVPRWRKEPIKRLRVALARRRYRS